MAYVAISNELQDAVRHGIQAMARRELETIGAVPTILGTEPFVEQALWGQHAALKTQMPKDWMQTADRIVLRIEFPEGAWQETMMLKNYQSAPPKYNCYSPPKVVLKYSDPEITHIVKIVSDRVDAQRRWAGVEKQVMEFLQKCKSLNEGLKLWPDLRMYIPPSYLDRVARKVERPKDDGAAAKDALKNMNTDEIVAAAVIARMSTGKNEES